MATATARVTVLMTPGDKETLTARARKQGVSVGELLRRSALESRSAEDEQVHAALVMLRESNAKASAALDKALSNITAREKEWEQRERRAVEAGRKMAKEMGWRS